MQLLRPQRVRRWHLALRVLFTCACVMAAAYCASPASARVAFRTEPGVNLEASHQGLGPTGKVPAWALHKSVYFLRRPDTLPPAAASAFAPPLEGSVAPEFEGHNTKSVGCEEYNKSGGCEHYYAPGLHRYAKGPHGEGGEVIHEPHVYLIFWGKEWETEEGLEGFRLENWITDTFVALEAEYGTDATYEGLLAQYHDDSGFISRKEVIAGTWHDNSVSYPTNIKPEGISAEINKAITDATWPLSSKNDIYLVMPAKAATWEATTVPEEGCAFHGTLNESTEPGKSNISEAEFGFVPYQGSSKFGTGCLEDLPEKHTNKEFVEDSFRETADSLTHEYAESVTDPSYNGGIRAWNNSEGYEAADMCQGGDGGATKYGPVNGVWVALLWSDEEAEAHGNSAGCTTSDPPAPPGLPPATTTDAPTSVTAYEATLNGSVNPNGWDTTYQFEYGTTEAYGTTVPYPAGNAGLGEEAVAVSAPAASLTPDTTYYYRLVAVNAAGAERGSAHTFTTPWPPPETKIKVAGHVGPTIATLNGEDKAEYGSPQTWYFEYGTTTSYGSKTAEVKETSHTNWQAVSAGVTGLAPNTLYHYRLTASTNGGTSHSPDATFTTTPSPEAVTESPTAIGPSGGTLNASINPGGLATTYQFEYWPTGKPAEVTDAPAVAKEAGAGTSLIRVSQAVTGLTEHGAYGYRIRAKNSVGTTYGETVTLVATPPYVPETTANPEAKEPKLIDISCSSAIACMATGEDNAKLGMLAERWNGTAWTLQSVPNVPGATEGDLGPVACTSATSCVALGTYNAGFMSETWNGSTWQVATLEAPNKAFTAWPRALSCTSATNCMAVGQYAPNGTYSTFADHWNGATWEPEAPPNPAGYSLATLEGVSCVSTTACTATGTYYLNPEESRTLVETWNGSTWTIQTSANVTTGTQGLNGVSCTSTSACMAVGWENPGTGSKVLTERWTGTEWKVVPAPAPIGTVEQQGSLESVSCTTASACVAVGYALVDTWNGTEWTVQSSTLPSNAGSENNLRGVTCTSSLACTAVGTYWGKGTEGEFTLAEAVVPPFAKTTPATGITGTSATLTGEVYPEGQETTYQFEYGLTPSYGSKVPIPEGKLAASWNPSKPTQTVTGLHLEASAYHYRLVATNAYGTFYGEDQTISAVTWAIRSTPTPTGATESALRGVSCVSLATCSAVGEYKNSSGAHVALADGWNGGSWTLQTPATPTGATATQLDSVSCTASNACTAVGSYTSSTGTVATLAERWNGSTWVVQTTPTPSGASKSTFEGVACSSATTCMAVGQYESEGYDLTLAEEWNGTGWTIRTTPNSTGAFNDLDAVTCTAATACTAVGTAFSEVIAERWNGTAWTLQAASTPTGSYSASLHGVSCASATSCTAVGYYSTAFISRQYPISESWNGSAWSRQTTPEPLGTTFEWLRGVACSSTTACTSVGSVAFKLTLSGEDTVGDGWSGAEWATQPTANVAGAAANELAQVWCGAANNCMAVGQYTSSTGTRAALAEESTP